MYVCSYYVYQIMLMFMQQISWKGPTTVSFLCCKHFEPDCFVTEGARYCDAVGIPAKKWIKPNAIPTIFLKSTASAYKHPDKDLLPLFSH